MNSAEVKQVINDLLDAPKTRRQLVDRLYWLAYSCGEDRSAARDVSNIVSKAVRRESKKVEDST